MFSKNFLLIIFFLLINFNAQSNDKIAFIDIEYLFENSNPGKILKENLKKIKLENLELIGIKEKKLVEQENEIKKTQNIISKEELSKKIEIFKENVEIYNKEKKIILSKFDNNKNSELKIFFDKINPILQDFMDKESINLLFEKKNIFIGRSNNDITNKVLEIINKSQ
jgi:Skp family chaperone for outer membrane proteins